MNIDLFKNDLLEFLNGYPAHVNAKKVFQKLKTENRHKKVKHFSHTIWEELEHLRIAQEDILRYMLEPGWKSPKWPEGYWPFEKNHISEQEWEQSLNGFLHDLQELQNFIKTTRIDITMKIPHTKNHTYFREILLIIDHNAYHLGKIVEIRKALINW